ARSQQHVEQLADRLRRAAHGRLDAHSRGIAALGAHLQHLAPEAVLARGYSITRDAAGNILRSAACASVGDTIRVQLSEGELSGTVSGKR
ncbi:MAG: exodeoxyribonuclease VII large subunit, partial [Azoarcus sp.]|nr:exodeoxyribonuclease VII large subunit [Azoarcus sp.]